MKKVKQLSLVALLSIFVFSASIANAQNRDGSGNGTRQMNNQGQGIENRIPDLTDQQKQEIKVLRTAHLKEVQQTKNQMDIKRAELKALQTADSPDLDAINKKIEERSALRTDLEKKSAAHKQAIRALLTDDQKVYYDKNMNHKGSKAHNCSGHKSGHNCAGKSGKPGCKK